MFLHTGRQSVLCSVHWLSAVSEAVLLQVMVWNRLCLLVTPNRPSVNTDATALQKK